MTDATAASGDAGALVSQGNAALIAGDAYTARQRYRQALDIDPRRVDALIGLAGSVRPYREKAEHLRRALAIDPANAEAQAVLAQVEARRAPGEELAPGGVQVREPAPSPAGPAAEEAPPALPVAPEPAADVLHCYIHPDRETGLRCTNCDRPICADCVRPAVVGQLCPECTKIRRPVNYQVGAGAVLIAGVIALIYGVLLAFLGSQLLLRLGFFSFIVAFLLGPMAGDLLIRLIDRFTHNKRGRPMQLAVGICLTLGTLPWILLITLVGRFPLSLIVFTIIAVATAVARLR
jgi:tetratricopeptide (TPR) repeat protein